jgi:hypothetical protein
MSGMGDPITQDVRALWLRLRKDGGWWTLDMLTHHWKPTHTPHTIQHAMDVLEARGFVESRDQATCLSYRVTSDCETLPGFEPLRHPEGAQRARHEQPRNEAIDNDASIFFQSF